MSISKTLIYEINTEIERAIAKWGEHDKDLHKMLNGVTEELLEVFLEVVHAVNHREGSAKVHEEIVHAIGVLVRLDEMAGNTTSQSNQSYYVCGFCELPFDRGTYCPRCGSKFLKPGDLSIIR